MNKSSKKVAEDWMKIDHPIFGIGGREPADKTETLIGSTNMFPKKQWRKGEFSIIPPCEITFGQWELYPVNGDVERFDTLEKAQQRADELLALPKKK